MSRMMLALTSMLGASKKTCPDCGSTLMNDGSCPECGYGGEDDGEMEEEDEQAETQALLELKDDLQRVITKIDRLIVKNCD
jgi:uncharacterized Zn finger protein (UPF0148 family)